MDAMRVGGIIAAALLAAGCSKKVLVEEPVEEFETTEMVMELTSEPMDTPSEPLVAGAPAPPPRQLAAEQPLSTFAIDVDTGSYSRVRRKLRNGERVPPELVRPEEFLNYFDHGYEPPASPETPFSATLELAPAPWGEGRHLLQIGLKGYDVPADALPPANFVFLVDTSGSMDAPQSLPLLTQALRDFSRSLRDEDRVTIVTYAGSAGLVLPPTPGSERARIVDALDGLSAGGSTDGGQGIALAYRLARENFRVGGNNRVILATDGDFNVGLSSGAELESMIALQAKDGIALTVLGFGDSTLGDRIAEGLADRGNGNYAFIDDENEADKVLRREAGGTLLTIASDVKVQVEFNPARVQDYRLIGYANRVLQNREFADDRVDAGEIGAGHDVTALYELTLADAAGAPASTLGPDEIARVRLRYKRPGEAQSRLLEQSVMRADVRAAPSERLKFAAAVAAFGELLGGRAFASYGLADVAAAVRAARLPDPHGERAELADLAELASLPPAPATQAPVLLDE